MSDHSDGDTENHDHLEPDHLEHDHVEHNPVEHDHAHSDHDHDHSGHGHSHVDPASPLRVLVAAAAGNTLLALVQLSVGLYAGSVALLADTGHQLVDVIGLVIAAVSVRLARNKTTTWSTYGWGRLDPAGALISATLLIGASIWVAVESVKRLRRPEPIQSGWVIAVAVIGLIVNGGSMFGLMRKGGESMSTKAAVLHLGGDAVGSLGVLIAGLFARRGVYWIDPLVALLLGAAIAYTSFGLLRSAFRVLLDATPSGVDVTELQRALTNQQNVEEVHHLHVWDVSPTERALTAHVRVTKEVSLHEGQDLADTLRTLVLDRFRISHATFEVECHECRNAHHA